jgi:hypothetical protein
VRATPFHSCRPSPSPRCALCAAAHVRRAAWLADRKLRLELSANYPPRTPPKEGEGYIFFQGPTPKTANQEGMPSFFSSENLEGASLPTAGKVAIGLGGALFLGLVATLVVS